MNNVILMGRLTKDVDVRYTTGEESRAIARYTLAVDRRRGSKDANAQTADFISCVAFGKSAEFAEKYLRKGMRILVSGSIRTGSYTNKDGHKVYTTDVWVDGHEFCDSKNSGASNASSAAGGSAAVYNDPATDAEGFMSIPDGVDDEALPFN